MADNRSFGQVLFEHAKVLNLMPQYNHLQWEHMSEVNVSSIEHLAKTILIAYCKGMYERTEHERADSVLKIAPNVTREQAIAISRDMMRIR